MVSVFRSSLKNKVENPTILKRETEREILIELVIIGTYSKRLQGNISREFLSWVILESARLFLSWLTHTCIHPEVTKNGRQILEIHARGPEEAYS